jgi:hypothetical protein
MGGAAGSTDPVGVAGRMGAAGSGAVHADPQSTEHAEPAGVAQTCWRQARSWAYEDQPGTPLRTPVCLALGQATKRNDPANSTPSLREEQTKQLSSAAERLSSELLQCKKTRPERSE